MFSSGKNTAGVTLLELAIVLVVIGLVVGGVLEGQSLIRSAQLQAAISERNQYNTAINSFKEKYSALPGDLTNAYAYWGASCGAGNTVTNNTAIGCNGDGDGKISWLEGPQFWRHLQLAGFIDVKVVVDCRNNVPPYVASTGDTVMPYGFQPTSPMTTTCTNYPGVTIPRSKVANLGWTVYYSKWRLGTIAQLSAAPSSITKRTIGVGSGLLPEDAYAIDAKIDDGKPMTGSVRGDSNAFYGCYAPASNSYNIAPAAAAMAPDGLPMSTHTKMPECALFFKLDV